jgi:hypothetical protein
MILFVFPSPGAVCRGCKDLMFKTMEGKLFKISAVNICMLSCHIDLFLKQEKDALFSSDYRFNTKTMSLLKLSLPSPPCLS